MDDPSLWVEKAEGWDTDKHYEERKTSGFSYADWINFNTYIAWVNINALTMFKTGHGYPGDLESMDEWVVLLDKMIDGFKAHIAIDDCQWNGPEELAELNKTAKEGLMLYAERFGSLWD